MLPSVLIVKCIYSGNNLIDLDKWLGYHKTRKGTSVVCFIASGLLIITIFLPIGFPSDWTIGIQGFAIGTFIYLGIINYIKPYVTASVALFKCLECGSDMKTSELYVKIVVLLFDLNILEDYAVD
jgi:hypothetical protein